MIDPRRRAGGSALSDLQAGGSAFRELAQQLGMSNPPQNVEQLLQYLGQFLSLPQMELVKYMLQPPQQFQQQDNVFAPGQPVEMPMLTTPVDTPPASDNVATMKPVPVPPGSTPPQAPQTPDQQQPDAQPAPQAATVTPKPAADQQITKVAAPRLDRDPDERIRMFMKDGSQTYWDPKAQTITPTAERVAPNQAVRFTVKLPNGTTQNIY